MNDIVGIDLGTTNSLIGVMDSGFPILIADANWRAVDSFCCSFSERRDTNRGAGRGRDARAQAR